MRGFGRIGRLSDGTAVTLDNQGNVTGLAPGGQNAQIPAMFGGGNIQGKGLYFCYQTPITTGLASLAPGASSTATIQFDQNSQFVWLRSTISAQIAGDVETSSSYVLPLVTLQMTDTGSGMAFSNTPIPIFDIAGTGQLPYVLPTPQFIQANASYQFIFNNFASATTYLNTRFTLHGYRVFNAASGTG